MPKVKNISSGPIFLDAGKCDPGECGKATIKQYLLLKSNGRIEDVEETSVDDYSEPPKAPPPPPKAAPQKKASKKKPTVKPPTDFM